MNPVYKWATRYTQYGAAMRIRSNTDPNKHYIVAIRMYPAIDRTCKCKWMERQDEKCCRHLKEAIQRWVDRKMAKRVHSLHKLKNAHSDVADEGLKIIAEQPRFSPLNYIKGDRLEKVKVAVRYGFVYENENWEQSDATNAHRFIPTDAGYQRMGQLKQMDALKRLAYLAEVEKKFGKNAEPSSHYLPKSEI